MTDSAVRVAAVTTALDWSLRQTCSQDRFDPAVAAAYVRARTEQSLDLMDRAAGQGVDLVLGPEYFWGSEMFMTTPENRRRLCEPVDGPSVARLREISKRRGVYLAATFNALHDGRIMQTAVLTGRRGELIGTHIKHNTIPPDCPVRPRADLFDLDVGRTGILICADCTDDPHLPLDMAARGMQLLLVPGVGFAGKFWQHYIVVRARDLGCPVVHADVGRALIVDREGETLARTDEPEQIVAAQFPHPAAGDPRT